jgi:hypothetical protein
MEGAEPGVCSSPLARAVPALPSATARRHPEPVSANVRCPGSPWPAVPGRGPSRAHTAPMWARPFPVSPFPSSPGVRPGCGRPRPSLPGTSISGARCRPRRALEPPPGNLVGPVHLWQVTGLPGAPVPATYPRYECLLPAGLTERDSIGIGESGRVSVARMKGLDHWSSESGAAALVSPGRRRPCETARLAGACARIWRRMAVFDKPRIAGSVRASNHGATTGTKRTHKK